MNIFRTVKMASDVHRVGGGFSVRFSVIADANAELLLIKVEWSPDFPTPAEIKNKIDASKYDAAVSQFASDVDAQQRGSHG